MFFSVFRLLLLVREDFYIGLPVSISIFLLLTHDANCKLCFSEGNTYTIHMFIDYSNVICISALSLNFVLQLVTPFLVFCHIVQKEVKKREFIGPAV